MYAFLSVAVYWLFAFLVEIFGNEEAAKADPVNARLNKHKAYMTIASQHLLQVLLQIPTDYGLCWTPIMCFSHSDSFSFPRLVLSYFGYVVVEYVGHFMDHYFHNSWLFGQTHRLHHTVMHPWGSVGFLVSWPSAIRGALFHMLFQIHVLQTPWRENAISQSVVYMNTILIHSDTFPILSRFHLTHHEKQKGNYSTMPPYWLDTWFGTAVSPTAVSSSPTSVSSSTTSVSSSPIVVSSK